MITRNPVGVFIFNERKQILIGKRADGKGWCAAGGKTDPGETIYQAAVRELKEETNLEMKEEDLTHLGSCITFDEVDDVNSFMKTEVFCGILKTSTTPLKESKELTDFVWVTLDKALKEYNLFYPTKISILSYKEELTKYSKTV